MIVVFHFADRDPIRIVDNGGRSVTADVVHAFMNGRSVDATWTGPQGAIRINTGDITGVEVTR